MSHLLFDRSTGALSPQAFARLQTTQRIHCISPAPKLRFDGGEKETSTASSALDEETQLAVQQSEKIWAHQAGVNALSLDIENRL